MSFYTPELINEGFVAQIEDGGRWYHGQFLYPNYGPFYNSFAAAKQQAGDNGKVYKVSVTYTEVTE